jgi:hypothetical protein
MLVERGRSDRGGTIGMDPARESYVIAGSGGGDSNAIPSSRPPPRSGHHVLGDSEKVTGNLIVIGRKKYLTSDIMCS